MRFRAANIHFSIKTTKYFPIIFPEKEFLGAIMIEHKDTKAQRIAG